ncbi:MAG: glutamate formimidoyltransferase [Proteobacteria bacterium]|nr:glutamate formimidoyltransferase [Pseudomonadota bacterium]
MKKIVECVPNFSEGRDANKIEKIIGAFQGVDGVKFLDYHKDADHNRLVVTVVGEPQPLMRAVVAAVGVAVKIIDMRTHRGQHPRMGAVDVIPFIPLKNVTMDEAIALSKETAKTVWEKYKLPVFLYEASAVNRKRINLAEIRKGQFEGMAEKIKTPEWMPDFGSAQIHPTAGVVAIGARKPLIAFNVNLDTSNIETAKAIAKSIRNISGGLRHCKAIGIVLKERGITQVSTNMTDFTKTPLYRVVELIRIEAKRYGVSVVGSEIVGLVPLEALIDVASYYMGLENFTVEQVLESRLAE